MKPKTTDSLHKSLKALKDTSNEEVFKTMLFGFARAYALYLKIDFDQDILSHLNTPQWWKADYGVSTKKGVAIGMDVRDAFKCLIDARRTFLFFQAIKETVQFLKNKKRKELTAIDAGTGTGILAIFLIIHGVKKVYAIEYNPQTYQITKEFIKQCGLEKQIILFEGDATKIQLKRISDIDILVSENYSTALMDEPQFQIINHLSQYLAPDAEIIPYRARLSVAVGNANWSQEEAKNTGIDMLADCDQLSDSVEYATVLSKKDMESPIFDTEVLLSVRESLPVNSLIFWTDMQLNRLGIPYWINAMNAEFVQRPWVFKIGDGKGILADEIVVGLFYQAGRRMTEMIVTGKDNKILLRDPFLPSVQKADESITNTKPKHIIIEAAHFYAEDGMANGLETISTELLQSIAIAQKITFLLEAQKHTIEYSFFIDDTAFFHHWKGDKHRILFESKAINRIRQHILNAGYSPSFYFLESDFERPAQILTKQLLQITAKQKQCDLSEDRRSIIETATGQSIQLIGKNSNVTYPSCEMLDVSLYQEKLVLADMALTILPRSYKQQQQCVKKLYNFLQQQPAVIVIYFSEDGNVSEVDVWSDELREMGAMLLALQKEKMTS